MCNISEHHGKLREIRSILHLFFLFGSLTTAQNLQTTSKKPSKSPHSYRLMPGITFYCHVVGPSPGPVARQRHGTFPGHQAPPPIAPRDEITPCGETPHSDYFQAFKAVKLSSFQAFKLSVINPQSPHHPVSSFLRGK